MKKGIGVLQQHFLKLVRHVVQVLLEKIIVVKVSYIHEPVQPALLPSLPVFFLLFVLQFVFNKLTSLGEGLLGGRVKLSSSTN